MRKIRDITLTMLAVSCVAVAADSALRQVQVIPLPGVGGRIDHLSVDVKGQRLFVSALGNNTIEVLDLAAGRRVHQIAGLDEPQGVLYVPEVNRIFVANARDGTVKLFDGASYRLLDTLHFANDADNLRYDQTARQVWVGYGDGDLAAIDAATGKRLGDIPLKGHPESFQLEKSGTRIFVNVPDAEQIAVVDRRKRVVAATWPVTEALSNFPMALDEADHRLLVVTRRPARLLVIDTESGKILSSAPSVGDADDVFYDSARHRAYVSGGEGFVDVFARTRPDDPDHYQRIEQIPTAAGARTSFFVPELGRLYLAVPHRETQQAEILVFEPTR